MEDHSDWMTAWIRHAKLLKTSVCVAWARNGPKYRNKKIRTSGRLEYEIDRNRTKTYHLECLGGLDPNDPFKHFGHKFGLPGVSKRHLPMALSLACLSKQYLPKVWGTFFPGLPQRNLPMTYIL